MPSSCATPTACPPGPFIRSAGLQPCLQSHCEPRTTNHEPRITNLRILAFTGGAGTMYCGSCLRDNALATALLARGHDVVLTPVYTPTRTDERNVSQPQVFFGGISVFLEQQVPLFRHTPRLLDRLWDAPSVIRLASKRQIHVGPKRL